MITAYFLFALSGLLFLSAAVGFVQVLVTRPDAFTAADRRPKEQWAAILGIIAIILGLQLWQRTVGFGIVSLICSVVLGVYYFDVRPQIKDILSGNYWY
ncbi:MAG: DUF2516 family protein [Corynebacterium sp.]|nr:DUF2516 family protein [Corynebacterium sp.]